MNGPETNSNFSGKTATVRTQWVDGCIVMDVSPATDGSIKKRQKITRELKGDQLHQTMEIEGGPTCKRIYKRVVE